MTLADELHPVTFDIRTPGNEETVLAQMAHAETLGLQEAVPIRPVLIVASGPSARHASVWERIAAGGVVTVAVNNALALFLERGLKPTYWAACDPQALVADFLPADPPKGIIYLCASKLHASVFAKLRRRDVRLWRIDDYEKTRGKISVPCACSITLVAQSLLRFMGFNRFEMYGWDCSYTGEDHHAAEQQHPSPGEVREISLQLPDGSIQEVFSTTAAWMAEANDACIQTHNLTAMGYEVEVCGAGMVGAILKGRGLL